MGALTLLAVAVALGTDAFSLALGMGLTGLRPRDFYFPVIVAVFHVFMPLAGMFAGRILGELMGQIAGVLGGVVLLLIGVRTLYNSLQETGMESLSFAAARNLLQKKRKLKGKPLSTLMFLAAGVSVDALSVGFGLGTLGGAIIGAVLVIGLVAGTMTALGLILGRFLGGWTGRWAETAGGLILLLIGLKIMV